MKASDLTDQLENLGDEFDMEVGTSFHYWCDGDCADQHNNGYGATFEDATGNAHSFDFWVDPRKIED